MGMSLHGVINRRGEGCWSPGRSSFIARRRNHSGGYPDGRVRLWRRAYSLRGNLAESGLPAAGGWPRAVSPGSRFRSGPPQSHMVGPGDAGCRCNPNPAAGSGAPCGCWRKKAIERPRNHLLLEPERRQRKNHGYVLAAQAASQSRDFQRAGAARCADCLAPG